MCGIAGILSNSPLRAERASACLAQLRHRGPDHQEEHPFDMGGKVLSLLHARLSIIDLGAQSDQPFHLKNKWLVFNGEIFNYREVRDQLRREGHRFTTESDTEVLARSIDAWGWAGLDKLEGMWAFALYDETEKALYLCRDRFGEKPLYLYRRPGGNVSFASEIGALSALHNERLQVNEDQVLRYLVNGYKSIHKQKTQFFHSIEEVAAGSIVRFDAQGRDHVWRYWHPKFTQETDMTFDEAVSGVRDHLIDSVDIRLRADVPLAFCMSGGVDSNALISIAKKIHGYDVHGFTILNTDARYEEQNLINEAVTQLGVKNTSIKPSTDHFLERLRTLIKGRQAPVLTISYYVQWLLYEALAKAGYRASISGTAADELFSGYYDHHALYLHGIQHDADMFGPALAAWQEHIAPIVRNPILQDPLVFIKNPLERRHINLDANVFSSFLKKPWQDPYREVFFTPDLMRNRMANELFEEVIPVILHEDDHNAMMHSVENRSPFLDRRLFEFSTRIPTRHLLRQGRTKAVLREAMRSIVPDMILDNRRKVGFNAPILELVDVKDPQTRKWLLDDSPIFELLERKAIQNLFEQDNLANSRSKFLFSFINAKIFLEEYS